MSTTTAIERLRQEQRNIEESLKELEAQKKEIDAKYAAVVDEENRIHEELRRCRDPYQYSQLEMRLFPIRRRRGEIEAEKTALERKIRGFQEELEKVKARIEYMRPKGDLIQTKE